MFPLLQKNNFFASWIPFAVVTTVIAFAAFLYLSLLTKQDEYFENGSYANIHLSPSGKLLAFDFCNKNNCSNIIYDIDSKLFYKYVTSEAVKIANLSFSPSGRRVVFIARKRIGWFCFEEKQQLVSGWLGENKFKAIGDFDGIKMYPTYSNEDFIYFWVSNQEASYKSQKFKGYSRPMLAEVNIKSEEVQLIDIDNSNYPYRPSAPSFFDDSDRIVFSDYGIDNPSDTTGQEKLYTDKLWVLSKSSKTISAVDTGGRASSKPVVAKQIGHIFFIGRTTNSKNRNVFSYEIFSHDGSSTKQVTDLGSYIASFDVSADGSVLFLAVESLHDKTTRLVIFNPETKAVVEISPKNISEHLINIEE